MFNKAIIVAFFALFCLTAQNTLAQSGSDLFQKGLVQERVKGDLEEAIKIYDRILEKFPDDRPIAALSSPSMSVEKNVVQLTPMPR